MPLSSLVDRILGCIAGGALGDAMGGPFEGRPGPLEYHADDAWLLSDDTQLTLATCEAICDAQGEVCPGEIAARFAAWFRQGRITGMGGSTLKALRDLQAGAHWALAGAQGERAAGNGAAMRIAPVAFLLKPEEDDDRQTLRDVARITHRHDEAYAGALAVAAAVRLAWREDFDLAERLLPEVISLLPDCRVRDRLQELAALDPGASIGAAARRFGSSGYVVDSVPLAIYAAGRSDDQPVEEILIAVIEAGGDTDTIASMTGQIAGARMGLAALPAHLLQELPERRQVLQTAAAFAQVVEQAVS